MHELENGYRPRIIDTLEGEVLIKEAMSTNECRECLFSDLGICRQLDCKDIYFVANSIVANNTEKHKRTASKHKEAQDQLSSILNCLQESSANLTEKLEKVKMAYKFFYKQWLEVNLNECDVQV